MRRYKKVWLDKPADGRLGPWSSMRANEDFDHTFAAALIWGRKADLVGRINMLVCAGVPRNAYLANVVYYSNQRYGFVSSLVAPDTDDPVCGVAGKHLEPGTTYAIVPGDLWAIQGSPVRESSPIGDIMTYFSLLDYGLHGRG